MKMEDTKKVEYELNYKNFINTLSDILLRNQDLFMEAIAENAVASFLVNGVVRICNTLTVCYNCRQ